MKNIFKKNQMIITALAIMIAVAGYLNYSGTKLDSASITAGSDAATKEDEDNIAADISAEDLYAQTGLEELQFADGDPPWRKIRDTIRNDAKTAQRTGRPKSMAAMAAHPKNGLWAGGSGCGIWQ